MGNETYKNSSIERKLEILGYAQIRIVVEDWMTTERLKIWFGNVQPSISMIVATLDVEQVVN